MVDLSRLKAGDVIKDRQGDLRTVTNVFITNDHAFFRYEVHTDASGIPLDIFSRGGQSETMACYDTVAIIHAPASFPASSAGAPLPDSQPFVSECGEALRFNSGKTPYGNLPLDLLDGAARVMAKGEVKYSRANYRKGYSDLLSPVHSLLRHAAALQAALEQGQTEEGGPMYDAETGECHAHHVITSALLLVQAMRVKGLKV